jgi:hypothetical protein
MLINAIAKIDEIWVLNPKRLTYRRFAEKVLTSIFWDKAEDKEFSLITCSKENR